MLGGLQDDLSYWGMGTHKDGTLYRWPQCKFVHPMRGDVGFLGGYYNDDGINLMHDNFFHPMARETQALLDLAEEEKPAIALHLHGGTNSIADLLQTAYVPRESGEAIRRLALRCDAAARQEGLYFTVRDVPEREMRRYAALFQLAQRHAPCVRLRERGVRKQRAHLRSARGKAEPCAGDAIPYDFV